MKYPADGLSGLQKSLMTVVLQTRIENLENVLERAELILRENGHAALAEEIDGVLNEPVDFSI